MLRAKRAAAITWRAIIGFVADDALTHSAAVAFYSVLSLAPILVLMLWISSGLGGEVQSQLVEELARLMGAESAEVVRRVIEITDTADDETATMSGWLSGGMLILSATAVFAQLQFALNAIWDVPARSDRKLVLPWLRKRMLSLGLIVSTGFLLLVSMIVSSALTAVLGAFHDQLFETSAIVWVLTEQALPFAVYLLLFMAVFRFVPDVRLRWRDVAFGSLVTAALFLLGKSCIGIYLGTSGLRSSYGAAGSLAMMSIWVYYSVAIVLFGAELTKERVGTRDQAVPLEAHAEPPATARSAD